MGLTDNIWRLFLAQPLALSATSALVLASGILSVSLAPKPELATLPTTLMIVGTAATVLPAIWLLKQIGRRYGTMTGLLIGFAGASLCCLAAMQGLFGLLLVGSFLIGVSAAFVAQLRFAAIESVGEPAQAPKALSILMTSGLFSAMLGPDIAVTAKDWIPSPYGFAGAFALLAVCYLFATIVVYTLDPIGVKTEQFSARPRSLLTICKNPKFIIAISSGVVAYSVMSYLMTASPLSMHADHAYDMNDIKWVVQSHVLAMYVPSLIAAWLIAKLGIRRLMLLGTILYVVVIAVSLAGTSVAHYWVSMLLLGIGWNFLYLCGTLLLPDVYQPHERFKVQALNDFTIFGIQAAASLSAGVILFSRGWANLVLITIPVVILMLMVTIWYFVLFQNHKLDTVEEVNG